MRQFHYLVDYMSDIKERIENTEHDIKEIMVSSVCIMLKKNKQRGDAWRFSGLIGQFIEIHSMYKRLRNLIWEIDTPKIGTDERVEWDKQIKNALEDLRNFTMLAEICLNENNIKGQEISELGERYAK